MALPGASLTDPASAVEEARAALGRLGRLRDLDELAVDLRGRGLKISPATEIRAAGLLTRLTRAGVTVTDGADAARWLAPILVAGRDDQELCRKRIVEWWHRHDPAAVSWRRDMKSSADAARQMQVDTGRRRLSLRIGMAALALALLAALLYPDWSSVQNGRSIRVDPTPPVTSPEPEVPAPITPDPVPDPGKPDPGIPGADETYAGVFTRKLLPLLVLFAPFAAAIWAMLTFWRRGTATLRRAMGAGKLFQSVPIPAVESDLFNGADASRAARGLKRATWRTGQGLDVPASIRETIRASGMPQVRHSTRRITHDYVLICERGGADDHVVLLADALSQRLAVEDVPFVRFDAHGHFRHLRHAKGRRHGRGVDSLAEIAGRHMGSRLIVLGAGDAFFDAYGAGLSDALGFVSSGRERRIFGAFDAPVLLSITPPARWGDRERRIMDEGVAVFPATTAGLASAAGYFTAMDEEIVEHVPDSEIAVGEDQLLSLMRRDRARLASDVAPEAAESARIARLLRAYMGDASAFRVLAAIFTFPRITLGLTRFLAWRIENRIIDEELAGKLARLIWLRDGRAPDWLRRAVLNALGEDDRRRLREGLTEMVNELGLGRHSGAAGGEPDNVDNGGKVDIHVDPGLRHLALIRLGLGHELVTGESLFLKFLDGADLDELDQPVTGVKAPPGWPRIGGAMALGVAGVLFAVALSASVVGFGPDLSGWVFRRLENVAEDSVNISIVLLGPVYWFLTLDSVARPVGQADDTIPWWFPGRRWLRRFPAADAGMLNALGRLARRQAEMAQAEPEARLEFAEELREQQRQLSALRAERRVRMSRLERLRGRVRQLRDLEWPAHGIVLALIWAGSIASEIPAQADLLIVVTAAMFLGLRLANRLGHGIAIVPGPERFTVSTMRSLRLGALALAAPLVVTAIRGLMEMNSLSVTGGFLTGLALFVMAVGAVSTATFAVLAHLRGPSWGGLGPAARRLAPVLVLHLVAATAWLALLIFILIAFFSSYDLFDFSTGLGNALPALFLIGPCWLLARQLPAYAPVLRGVIWTAIVVGGAMAIGLAEFIPEIPASWLMAEEGNVFSNWPTIGLVTMLCMIFGTGAMAGRLPFEITGREPGPQPPLVGPMPFGTAVKTCLRKYITFSGRATRAEYWWFFLFQRLSEIAAIFFLTLGIWFPSLILIALWSPGIAVTVRRLHDIEKTGKYVWAFLIPLFGFFFLFVWKEL